MTKNSGFLCILAVAALAACDSGNDPGVSQMDVTPPGDAHDTAEGVSPDLADADLVNPDVPPDAVAEIPADGIDANGDANGGPRIQVVPEALDLGFAPQGLAVRRTVTVSNAGDAPLTVTTVSLPQDSGGEITVDAGTLTTSPLAAGANREVVVTTTNAGAATGAIEGLLRIESNDPERPTVDVSLTGQRSGPPTCTFAFTPDSDGAWDLGTVAAGTTAERTVTLTNTGTGGLAIERLDVYGCAAGDGGTTCGPARASASSWQVELDEGQPSEVPSGGSTRLKIRLSLPSGTKDATSTLAALLAMTWTCPLGARQPEMRTWPEGCVPDSTCAPNLVANAVPALLDVQPPSLAFPDTQAGCGSEARSIHLANTSGQAVTVTSIQVDPACAHAGEFVLVNPPGLPAVLHDGEALDVQVVFQPDDAWPVACDLQVTLDGTPPIVMSVPMSGKSSDGRVQDRWWQVANKSDVLFVIDTSGSMLDGALDRLVASVPALMDALAKAGMDPHVGVIGVGVDAACPASANLRGTPRVMDSTTIDAFSSAVAAMVADTSCDGSTQEAGLEAMRLALSQPRVGDEGISCATDLACTPPYGCVDGTCGGKNRGFLRADATLDVIVLADEDDQSPDDLMTYRFFLDFLKGLGGAAMTRLHAIAGDSPGGCANTWDTADECPRYVQAAADTGGTFASICQGSFDPAMETIGSPPPFARTVFPLSTTPIRDTVTVTVDGQPCTEGWSLSFDDTHVDFTNESPCFPQPGVEVVVEYVMACP